jgi:hypothetical protein
MARSAGLVQWAKVYRDAQSRGTHALATPAEARKAVRPCQFAFAHADLEEQNLTSTATVIYEVRFPILTEPAVIF